MRLQHVFRPYREVLDHDTLKLRMPRYVGGQITTHERDDTGDAWVSEALNQCFASYHSACSDDEDLHGDGGDEVDNYKRR